MHLEDAPKSHIQIGKVPKILVVDDEPFVQMAIKMALDNEGYELYFADDGQKGLKLFHEENPELIFLDLEMPIMNGYDFLKAVQAKHDSPFTLVVITGHGDDQEIERCYKMGIDFFLKKPLSMVEICGLARRCIGLKRLEMERNCLLAELQESRDKLEQRVEDSELLNQAMVNLLDDIQTANKKLESTAQQLRGTNIELESFSYSVSHDLRAPLRHMSGFAELLEKNATDSLDDKSRRYIKIINEASAKMGMLIDDLLYYSRTGRADIKKCEIDNNTLVREVVNELASSEKGREITWQIEQLEPAYADFSLLRIVWTNLLGNAAKFTRYRDKALIIIGSTPGEEGDTIYYVKDNGAGFDMKYYGKIFGVFQRLHNEREFEGTGIGLATVQRIILRHGGRVWAEGEVGVGATFYFAIPVNDIQ